MKRGIGVLRKGKEECLLPVKEDSSALNSGFLRVTQHHAGGGMSLSLSVSALWALEAKRIHRNRLIFMLVSGP